MKHTQQKASIALAAIAAALVLGCVSHPGLLESTDGMAESSNTWQVGRCDNTVVSLVNTQEWDDGGAHGNRKLVSFNWDPQQKKELALADLLPRTDFPDLDSLAVKVRAELEKSLNPEGDAALSEMIAEGTTPTAEHFSVFLIEPQGGLLTFFFQPYQVAPWSAGTPTVTVTLR
jgi:hypothetical protein